MTKFFIRILKFSGPYRNRVLSAAVFAFNDAAFSWLSDVLFIL